MTEFASPADQKLLALANRLVGSAGRGHANALSRLDGRCEPLPFVPSVRESCLELIHHADTHT